MFTEEVGVDPRLGGMEHLYAQRVADLLQGRRALARFSGERVMFKAEIGAATARAVQIQGVWVDPVFRGRGLAAPGMAAVVEYGLRVAPMVTLYVNGYNTPALATYRTVGFRQVGTFATVLF
jgi:predicted GNAT family acetyltransferase